MRRKIQKEDNTIKQRERKNKREEVREVREVKNQDKQKDNSNIITILCDTREQLNYTFKKYPCKVERVTLKTGDYSLKGYEKDGITIERKSLQDLYQSFGQGRERFEREWQRMQDFEYAAIVIESTLTGILTPPQYTQMLPRVIIQSLISWSIKYHVNVIYSDSRELSECYIFSLLEKFYKHHQ
jgi:ERCC4-type nuclease